jgi:ubiquinone/menaquinone biosynthesis C-methylase UbiE
MDTLPVSDFDQLATDFDRFLPQIHPVTLALLDRLPPPAAGAKLLDVACGTGEPGLTLLRLWPNLQLLGVDQSDAMIAVARNKAAREALHNARFVVMNCEALTLPDASVDAAVSRFGVLMFGDVPASSRELSRVLLPGGHFSIAVWDELAGNTLINVASEVMRAHLPRNYRSPLEPLEVWAGEERRPRALRDAGFAVVRTEPFAWSYRFASFEEVWDPVNRLASITGQAQLPPETHARVKEELAAALLEYRQPEGTYIVPQTCRLLWGQR